MNLTAKQEEGRRILSGPAKHILLEGGSRSGKTFLIVRQIVVRAIKAQKSRHAILRFRFNHCKESIGMDTFPAVMARCFPEVPYVLNKSEWFATFPNRAEIWIAGLDDKDRTEKVLGKEFVTIYLNECSQIPWQARNIAVTRLAQLCPYELGGQAKTLNLKMFYDCNPPTKAHWTYRAFHQLQDPETRRPLVPEDYAHLRINPDDNRENLPPDYITELDKLTGRLRRRFLLGEYGDAAPGALWSDEIIDRWRVLDGSLPDMQRIVVAVDPSGADDEDNAENDEIGIVVAGLGTDGNGYVLEDLTLKAGPSKWGKVATSAFERHAADKIVAEINYGGAMVKHVIQTARPNTPLRVLTASRGKVVRAEPISSLTEQGKIRFVGYFANLEDELCAFTTHGYTGGRSPNRGDAFVWAMSELFPGLVKVEPEPKDEEPQHEYAPSAWMN